MKHSDLGLTLGTFGIASHTHSCSNKSGGCIYFHICTCSGMFIPVPSCLELYPSHILTSASLSMSHSACSLTLDFQPHPLMLNQKSWVTWTIFLVWTSSRPVVSHKELYFCIQASDSHSVCSLTFRHSSLKSSSGAD